MSVFSINRFNVKQNGSACPGFFRMTKAVDGRICRIKLPFGSLTSEQLSMLAYCAKNYGTNCLELTSRANIQLRGIKENAQNTVIACLSRCQLGPLNRNSDDMRNVLLSASAGIDPYAFFDSTYLAHRLLKILQTHPLYQKLSPKFSILINAGERTENEYHQSDIWLSACKDKKSYALGLASAPKLIKNQQQILGICPAHKVLSSLLSCLDTFILWQKDHPSHTRIKDIFAQQDSVYAKNFLFLLKSRLPNLKPFQLSDLDRCFPRQSYFYYHQKQKDLYYLIVKPPLGRLSAESIEKFLKILSQTKGVQIRVHGSQGFILFNCLKEELSFLAYHLQKMQWGVSPKDPYSRITCCVGAPYCAKAHIAVQRDAHKIANIIKNTNKANYHLSGCDKKCALNASYQNILIAQKRNGYKIGKATIALENPDKYYTIEDILENFKTA